MALNIADLLEHAVDLFPDRIAVACGEQQVTYAELEERANRLAHHLAAHGVGAGSHVGLCTRNSIEAIEAMVAVYKLRAVIINVNYRYTAAEIKYVLDNADVVALVHDRQYSDRIAAVLVETPQLEHVVVIDDGSQQDFDGVAFADALADGSPERDFAERSADDLYILYTGGTTGVPKGVMWRHEDIWRSLGGGINFVTGEPLPDEWAQSESGKITGGLVRLCIAPLIHGNAQWAALAALFGGDTVVLEPKFDAHAVWRAIERRRVNVVVLIGDAMARPIIEAFHEGSYDPTSVYAVSSSAALFSQTVKDEYLKALPNVVITDAVGSSESGFNGIGMITKDTPPTTHGPRVTLNSQSIVIDDQGKPVEPGSGVVGRIARGGHVPLGYYKDRSRPPRCSSRSTGSATPCPATSRSRGGRDDDAARPRQHLRQHRRREGLPRRGRGRAEVAPGRVRRARRRRARRAARPARRGHRAATRRRHADIRRTQRTRAQRDRRLQGAQEHVAGRRGAADAHRQARLPLGQHLRD